MQVVRWQLITILSHSLDLQRNSQILFGSEDPNLIFFHNFCTSSEVSNPVGSRSDPCRGKWKWQVIKRIMLHYKMTSQASAWPYITDWKYFFWSFKVKKKLKCHWKRNLGCFILICIHGNKEIFFPPQKEVAVHSLVLTKLSKARIIF